MLNVPDTPAIRTPRAAALAPTRSGTQGSILSGNGANPAELKLK
jgi:hypothetical protein